MWIGLSAVLLASFFFGSVFVPIRKVYAGDGFITQLFVACGAFSVGIIVHAILGFPGFYPFAMLGGFLWAFANTFSIQIINRLGMGLANLIWNSFSCLSGWATSRFGLLGLTAAVPASTGLNYIGIVILICGAGMYSLVKNNAQRRPGHEGDGKESSISTEEKRFEDISMLERIASVTAAVVSGFFYGTMWLPVNYMMAHRKTFPSIPTEPLSFMFSYTCGIFCTAVCVFLIYAIRRRNHPWVNPESFIPAFGTGIVYTCGMSAFVVAIDKLDASIAYPIGQMAPGLVVSLWSVLYYREISGRRNLLLLAGAYLMTVVGVSIVTISREIHMF